MLANLDPADLDHGPRTAKSGIERMCAVSRQVRPTAELIRFVVAPTGEVVADLKRKLPGRGLWVSASRAAVAEAVKRKAFGRGFKREVRVAPTLAEDTGRLLAKSAVEALAIAAKAGQVVSGFAKVEEAIGRGGIAALIHASDGAEDGIRKLNARLAAVAQVTGENTGTSRVVPVITALSSDELDLALGRSNVIHAAVLAGPAGGTFLLRSQFLVRYRAAEDSHPGQRPPGRRPRNSAD
jgi:predicted RNA-binding protein YlxR (DUF448 family)